MNVSSNDSSVPEAQAIKIVTDSGNLALMPHSGMRHSLGIFFNFHWRHVRSRRDVHDHVIQLVLHWIIADLFKYRVIAIQSWICS